MKRQKTIQKRIQDERTRLEGLLDKAEVPKQKQAVLETVIANLAAQRIMLEDTLEEMRGASVVCEYDNGGGQSGVRENPIFKAYISLWRGYMVGLEKYSSYLPKELQEDAATDSMDVLAQVKLMKKATV